MWKIIATAYIAKCLGCTGITASGMRADYRKHYVAASPHWPLGTCVELKIQNQWVRYTVQDRGPKKKNHFDILVSNKKEALDWGVRSIQARPCTKTKNK
jgi:3D (Asp-Asp-Asp) domain-containing protein